MTKRWFLRVLLLSSVTLAGCAAESVTEILVVVDSNLSRADVSEVQVRAALAGAEPTRFTAATATHAWPMTFALLHEDGPLGPLRVEVEGHANGNLRISRTAETAFVPQQIMVLRMDLFSECIDRACNADETCTERGCVAIAEADPSLSPWLGHVGARPPWNASADRDATDEDGGMMMTSPADARDASGKPDMRSGPDAAPVGQDAQHGLGACGMFPNNDVWHVDVRSVAVAPQSPSYVNALGGDGAKVNVGFGVDRGIIWRSVDDAQATSEVELTKPNVKVAWPVPASYPLADSAGARLLLVNRSKCVLYEALGCQKLPVGYLCETGGAAALNAAWVRQPGSVLAQDSGLAMLPGLLRFDEVQAGAVQHAVNVAAGPLRAGFVAPALNHLGGSATSSSLPPMGVRLRLRPTYPETNLGEAARTIVKAMKAHGVIVTHRENGINLMGERHNDWSKLDLRGLSDITASDFEALAHGMITE